jgi:hypothetical protein
MIFLPKNLGALAAVPDAGPPGRYATAAVHVLDEEGHYRCEATDGKALAVVRGPSTAPSQVPAALEEAPNGCASTLVPARDWKTAFQLAPKGSAVGLVASAEKVTLAGPGAVTTCAPIEGRFPNVDAVLPGHGPLARIHLDPRRLAALLQVAAAILEADKEKHGGPAAVELMFYGRGKPLGLMGRNAQGQTFDALLMPLDVPEPPPVPAPDTEEEDPEHPDGPPADNHLQNGKAKRPHRR